MGQGSSTSNNSSHFKPAGNGNLMVDASDSYVTTVRLKSTGIIPISEYIKKEKYSKNIQRLEGVKSSSISELNLKHPDKNHSKKKRVKDDFIETSYEDLPENRRWLPNSSKWKSKSNTILSLITNKLHYDNSLRSTSWYYATYIPRVFYKRCFHHLESNDYDQKKKYINPKNIECAYVDRKIKDKKRNNSKLQSKLKDAGTLCEKQTCSDSSTQTPKSSTTDDLKQIYKRHDDSNRKKHSKKEETSRTKHKTYERDEKSTHTFQNHQMSQEKIKRKKLKRKFVVQTNLACTIPPDKFLQLQYSSTGHIPTHRERKLAGECYDPEERILKCHDIPHMETKSSVFITESSDQCIAKLEKIIKGRKSCSSGKQALENWKNLHTLKQTRKLVDRSKNSSPVSIYYDTYHDCFDAATQTTFVENRCKSMDHHHSETQAVQKQLLQDKSFITDMEKCLKKHSKICAEKSKTNGEGKSTWVQDKYRKWHKIIYNDYQ